MRTARLALLSLIVVACGSGAVPTPQIIYVTPAPTEQLTVPPTTTPSPTTAPVTASPELVHDIPVTLKLTDFSMNGIDFSDDGYECFGAGGYSDLPSGTQFTIEDADGTVVAFGSMDGIQEEPFTCTFSGMARDVPDMDVYEIGRAHV